MTPPVAGEEGDAPTLDLTDGERCGRLPVRGLDLDLLDVVEELVEPRAPEDADLGAAQADFSFVPPSDDDEPEPVAVSFFADSFFAGSFLASPSGFEPPRESVA